MNSVLFRSFPLYSEPRHARPAPRSLSRQCPLPPPHAVISRGEGPSAQAALEKLVRLGFTVNERKDQLRMAQCAFDSIEGKLEQYAHWVLSAHVAAVPLSVTAIWFPPAAVMGAKVACILGTCVAHGLSVIKDRAQGRAEVGRAAEALAAAQSAFNSVVDETDFHERLEGDSHWRKVPKVLEACEFSPPAAFNQAEAVLHALFGERGLTLIEQAQTAGLRADEKLVRLLAAAKSLSEARRILHPWLPPAARGPAMLAASFEAFGEAFRASVAKARPWGRECTMMGPLERAKNCDEA